MKPRTYFVASLMFVFPLFMIGQSSGIDAALSKGSAADLGVFFSEKIDVSILNNDASLSADQAIVQLNNFFTQNTIKGYKRAHLAAPSDGRASYSIGDLYTATGTYRIYLYFDANQKISEIRIEK